MVRVDLSRCTHILVYTAQFQHIACLSPDAIAHIPRSRSAEGKCCLYSRSDRCLRNAGSGGTRDGGRRLTRRHWLQNGTSSACQGMRHSAHLFLVSLASRNWFVGYLTSNAALACTCCLRVQQTASTNDPSADPLLSRFCVAVSVMVACWGKAHAEQAAGLVPSCVPCPVRTRLEVADVPVDVPEMRDTRQRYVHTIAGGPRDAQPLGALCSDRCCVSAPRSCPVTNRHLPACLPLLCRCTNRPGYLEK